jgi:magnesium chelatase family protein
LVVLASVRSATLLGIDGHVVSVEVHVSNGLPSYSVVGLPDAAGRESRERVRAALLSTGLEFPMRRITVNLAPATVRKAGSGLELAIALALLVADGALPDSVLDGTGVIGELGLDGRVRPASGVLALVDALTRRGVERVVVPDANAIEAALVPHVEVFVARTLGELHECLKGEAPWPEPTPVEHDEQEPDDEPLDLGDVRGLPNARQALVAAAAGGHHLLIAGPPGAGKTMLARRLPTILAPLERDEAIEVTRIHSASGVAPTRGLVTQRPFRAPHHTASTAAIVGGGSPRPRPGEVTLAHRGALFLDEIAEFNPSVLESLRQPLEERTVRISRAAVALDFPAAFTLIACCNPCPCGRDITHCRCSDVQRQRYKRRLSSPLLDRFDLRVPVNPPGAHAPPGEPSATVRERVLSAVERQRARLRDWPWRANAHIPAGALQMLVPLRNDVEATWRDQCELRHLTGRGAARARRVARTLADLDARTHVDEDDITCALELRQELFE